MSLRVDRFELIAIIIFLLPGWVFAASPGKIQWDESTLEIKATRGTSAAIQTTFQYSGGSKELEVWLTPSINKIIEPVLTSKVSVSAGSATIQLLASVPVTTKTGVFQGTLHLRDGRRTLARPLKIKITVDEASAQQIPIGPASPSSDRIAVDPESGASYLRGEVLIGLSEGHSESDLIQIVSALGGQFLGSIQAISVYQAVFPGVLNVSELDFIVHELGSSEVTRYAERSWLLEPLKSPDDPVYGDPEEALTGWDESAPDGLNAPFEYTRFPSAWDKTTGKTEVRIAVIDTAFDPDHSDLKDNVANVNTRNSINTYNFQRRHGTAVASVLAAQGNNGRGITGAMWDASLVLYSTAILPTDVMSSAFILDAISAAIHEPQKPRIINLSLKTPTDRAAAFRDVFTLPEAKDVLFVIAAGNETTDDVQFITPAKLATELPNVISVTEIDIDESPDSLVPAPIAAGAVGDVDVAAPGCFLYLAPNNLTGGGCGSSYAAPMVSGLAGLLLSYDDTISAERLKQLIIRGANEGDGDRRVYLDGVAQSFKIIDAAKSLELAEANTDDTRLVEISATGRVVDIVEFSSISAPADVTIGTAVHLNIQYNVSDAERFTENVGQSIGRYVFTGSEETKISIEIGDLLWESGVPQEPGDFLVQRDLLGRLFQVATLDVPIEQFVSFPGRDDELSGIPTLQGILNFTARGTLFRNQDLDLVDSLDDFNSPLSIGAEGRIVVRSLAPFAFLLDIKIEFDKDSLFFNGEPLFEQGGPPAEISRVLTEDTNGKDIWTTSVFSSDGSPGGGSPGGGRNDEYLQVGGWGDFYNSLIQFDLTGLPESASSARIELYLGEALDSRFSPVGMWLDVPTEDWDWRVSGTGRDNLRLWWADRPSVIPWSIDEPQPMPAPTIGEWYSIDITNLYNAWQASSTSGYTNFGIQLRPTSNSQDMNYFSSSNSTDPSLRPRLIVTE